MIYLLNYKTNKISIKKIISEINYIYKINDEFFLASIDDGIILNISIDENGNIFIEDKKFIKGDINSLFLKNFKSILITSEENAQIWTNQSKENKDESCLIF